MFADANSGSESGRKNATHFDAEGAPSLRYSDVFPRVTLRRMDGKLHRTGHINREASCSLEREAYCFLKMLDAWRFS